jgi:Autographiviridae endonuclease VII
MKRCKKCGVDKPLDDFYRARRAADGYRSECKECNLAAKRARYRANPQPHIDRVRAWRNANVERARETQRRANRRRRGKARDDHLRRTFGISSEEYDAMLAEQGGVCGICGSPPPDGSSLHVDHDAKTGRIRGLLCFRCNAALGQLRDSVDLLLAGADYLDGALESVPLREELRDAAVARARLLVKASG